MYNSLHYRMILLHSICQVLHLYSLGEEYDKSGKKVCRNTRCAFFFFIDYKNRFIFFKLRYFEDFFGLCVRNI